MCVVDIVRDFIVEGIFVVVGGFYVVGSIVMFFEILLEIVDV